MVRCCRGHQLERLSATVRRWYLLDTRLRHRLRPPGESGPSMTRLAENDTLYSQDKSDDVTMGIRSTALLFGERTRPVLAALSASSMSFITYAGFLNGQGPLFYGGVALAAAQLARVVWRTDFDDRPSCWRGFVGCGWSGFWIWMGTLADYATLLLTASG